MTMRWNHALNDLLSWLFALRLVLPAATLAGPDAREIMERADRQNRPTFEIARMRMELVDESGDVLTRRLTWHFRNRGEDRESLMKFDDPANVRDVGLLVKERQGEPNAIWHYLPATRNVRRISAQHKRNRFMGTEFVFEDFEGLKLDKYDFELLRSEPCGEKRICQVVEGRASGPQERDDSGYSRKRFWVGQDDAVIVKIELYDRGDHLAKVFSSEDFRQIGEYWRPVIQTMHNLTNNRETRLIEEERKIDEPFDPYYVSQQYLRSE